MKLKYKILDNRIGTEFDIPRYQTAGSAGMDLIACCDESITLSPNESTIIPSGISIFIEASVLFGEIIAILFLFTQKLSMLKYGLIKTSEYVLENS